MDLTNTPLTCQYILFVEDTREASEPPADFVETLAQPVPGTEHLNLKLPGKPLVENSLFSQAGGPFTPTQKYTWTSGSGLWKIIWTQMRIDVHFDGPGYFEVFEKTKSISDLNQRIIPNLEKLTKLFGSNIRIGRLALVVSWIVSNDTYQATHPSKHISSEVAKVMLSESFQHLSQQGELLDLNVRVNCPGRWGAPSGKEFSANRLEFAAINVGAKTGDGDLSLAWQFDVNTSLRYQEDADFKEADLKSFFLWSTDWVNDRIKELAKK